MEDASAASLSFEERFGLLVDHHWSWRENQAMARRLKKSKLDAEPCVEDIDYAIPAVWTGSSCAAWLGPSGWSNIFPSC